MITTRIKSASHSISLLYFFAIASVTLSVLLLNSHSQESNSLLPEKINKMIKTLESEKTNNPKIQATLDVVTQLKLTLSNTSPASPLYLTQSISRLAPGEHRSEILKLLEQVSQEIERRNTLQQKHWSKAVDEYLLKVEKSCVGDMISSKLEELLLESEDISQIRPKNIRSSPNKLNDSSLKFSSATNLLQKWISYKRLEEKGYLKQANDKLKSLSRSTTQFPILDKKILQEKITENNGILFINDPESKGDFLSAIQLNVISQLKNNELDTLTLQAAAKQLDALPISHNMNTKYDYGIYMAIQALAECSVHIDNKDFVKARDKLSEFAWETASLPQLKKIRSIAVFKYTPILYAQIGAKKNTLDQTEKNYLYSLIRKPKSLDEITASKDLINYYQKLIRKAHYQSSIREADWLEAAKNQYQSLKTALAALASEDFSYALKNLREAQTHAVGSGSASAEKLITLQIKNLHKNKPELFEPSVSVVVDELNTLKEKIDKLTHEMSSWSQRRR